MHLLLSHVLTQVASWWTQVPFYDSLVTSAILPSNVGLFLHCLQQLHLEHAHFLAG